jgi:large subunit ribosomal protein L30
MPSLKVTLTRSPIGFEESQKRTVRALGLTRMNKTVVRPDNPQVRGMLNAVSHLVKVEVVDGECERRNRSELRKHKG